MCWEMCSKKELHWPQSEKEKKTRSETFSEECFLYDVVEGNIKGLTRKGMLIIDDSREKRIYWKFKGKAQDQKA